MQPPKHRFFVLLLVLAISGVQAQDFIVLEKMGTKKRYEYYSGDEIIFKLKSDEFFRKEEIIGISDTSIVFGIGSIPLKDIDRVSLSNKKVAIKGIGATLVVAGLGYMAIDLFNKAYSNTEIYVDPKVARSAGIIAGTGLAMIIIAKKKVSLKNNWRLRIVDI